MGEERRERRKPVQPPEDKAMRPDLDNKEPEVDAPVPEPDGRPGPEPEPAVAPASKKDRPIFQV